MAKRDMPSKDKFVNLGGPEESELVQSEPKKRIRVIVANCNVVNVREKPSRNSKVVFTAVRNTYFGAESLDEEWTHVRSLDKAKVEGYIATAFLKEI